MVFNNNLIVQWGNIATTTNDGTFTKNFPITFPRALFSVTMAFYKTGHSSNITYVSGYNKSSVTFHNWGNSNVAFYISIGY